MARAWCWPLTPIKSQRQGWMNRIYTSASAIVNLKTRITKKIFYKNVSSPGTKTVTVQLLCLVWREYRYENDGFQIWLRFTVWSAANIYLLILVDVADDHETLSSQCYVSLMYHTWVRQCHRTLVTWSCARSVLHRASPERWVGASLCGIYYVDISATWGLF
jgi:hypothetical protein